ncbi:MAG: metal-dependent hydrolase [Planctomycetota bacterium]|nr:metal-dependent hydrolase [Planctomycetota bacterium]
MAVTSQPDFWQCPRCKTPNPWATYLTVCVGCGEPKPPEAGRAAFVPQPKPVPKAKRSSRGVAVATWGYAAVVLVALGLIKTLGDRWWPATVLMFAPRWIFLFPIPPLILWAGLRRRWRLLLADGAVLAVVLGPLMGLCLPVRSLIAGSPEGLKIRVLSLNRGSGQLASKELVRMIGDEKIDVVCFQEARPDPVLDAYFARAGWTRNAGGSIFSHLPVIKDYGLSDLPYEAPDVWDVKLTRVSVRLDDGREAMVACVHMPTMTYGFARLFRRDFAGMRRYIDWRWKQTDSVLRILGETATLPTVVAGDFNMPPDSPMMHKLRASFPSGFEEVGWGYGYTRPSRASWIGIDRILASKGSRFSRCRVGPRVGSDHRPILAEVILRPPSGLPDPPPIEPTTSAATPTPVKSPVPSAVQAAEKSKAPTPRRVVCLGDSITDEFAYPEFAWKALDAAGMSGWTFLNAGVGGDSAETMRARLDRDVLSLRPEVVTISAGVNDALKSAPPQVFEVAVVAIVDRLKAEGISVVLLPPTPLGKAHEEANQRISRFADLVREIAARRGLSLADVHRAMLRENPDGADPLLGADGIHPNKEGHRVMARTLVEALGARDVAIPDDLAIEPVPGLIREWRMVAVRDPATASSRIDPGVAHGKTISLPESNPQSSWQREWDRRRGYALSLKASVPPHGPYQGSATITVDREKTVVFRTGGMVDAIWLNGEMIHRNAVWTGWHPGNQRITARLHAGENAVVIAVHDGFLLGVTDE